jgi:hypothetical protein
MLVMIARKEVIDQESPDFEQYLYHYNQITYPFQLLNGWLKQSKGTYRNDANWQRVVMANALVKGTPDQEAAYEEEQRVWDLENERDEHAEVYDYDGDDDF